MGELMLLGQGGALPFNDFLLCCEVLQIDDCLRFVRSLTLAAFNPPQQDVAITHKPSCNAAAPCDVLPRLKWLCHKASIYRGEISLRPTW